MAYITKKFDFLAPDYTEVKLVLDADVSAGDFEAMNDVNGFHIADALDGDTVSVITKCRKTKVVKATGAAWAVGNPIYYNSTNGNCTTTGTSANLVGYANEAAASAATVGYIDFDGHAEYEKA